MRVELDAPADLAGFRRAARRLLGAGVPPAEVDWAVAGDAAPELFDVDGTPGRCATPPAATPANGGAALRVPAAFVALCREVVLHRSPTRFSLLYRLLWRLQQESGLRHDPVDAEMLHARQMAQQVRRDVHKMKAFVRFRPIERADDAGAPLPPLHIAWFEPQHHIVEAAAPFFARRFAAMQWALLTPERCVRWDGQALEFGPGAARDAAPPADAGEALWLTYYRAIFNPARLKLRAMAKEMPRRYWSQLPEAVLISQLSAQASARTGAMIDAAPTPARAPVPAWAQAASLPRAPRGARGADDGVACVPPRAGDAPAARQGYWRLQRDAAAGCRECPLGDPATQTVWGEGPIGAALMLVGEQPGDQEDLQGRPFVGPAGQLLARALGDLGWDRDRLYLTNAVKHFKYEPRGKRRLHKTPGQREAAACAHWLEAEIAAVQPQAIVALGATAARQLLGRDVAVTRERGRWLARSDGIPVLVTLHPSALLRTDPADRAAAEAAWRADLTLAAPVATAAPPAAA